MASIPLIVSFSNMKLSKLTHVAVVFCSFSPNLTGVSAVTVNSTVAVSTFPVPTISLLWSPAMRKTPVAPLLEAQLAVISELVETMRDQMQDGKRVKLDGFGSFKIGLQCHGAANAKEFSVGENIDGVHVVFSPERSTDAAGNRTKQFLQDVQLEELPENKVEKKESGD